MRQITNFQTFQVERKKRRARRNRRVTRRGRMMASNASQITIRKIATPAAKAPGAGIMCGIVPVRPVRRECGKCAPSPSGFETRADADFGLEQFRNRAARFRSLNRRVELGLVRARNFCDEVEVALGDCETVRELLQGNGGGRLQLLRAQSGVTKLRGERHRETPGMRRCKKFLRIGTHAIFKSRAERILRLLPDAALSGNRALAILQTTLPDCRCLPLHVSLLLRISSIS